MTGLVTLQSEKIYALFMDVFHFSKNFNCILIVCFRNKQNNSVNVYHRFETQGRHTVHILFLVWINSFKNITLERVKTHVPNDHSRLAYLVINVYFIIVK